MPQTRKRFGSLTVLLLAALSVAGVHLENRVKAFSAPQTSSLNEISLATTGSTSGDFGRQYDGRVQLTPFGNVRSAGGEALPEVSFGGDSRFQGMWKDAGTGLYYVRARYYDPRTGRFLSRDPAEGQLETPESFYPYVFANGNPYVFRDRTGLFTLAELSIANSIRLGISDGQATVGLSFIDQLQAARGDVSAIGDGVVRDVATGVAFGAVGAVGIVGINLLRGLRAGVPTRLIIGSGQFGRKVAQRARDLGLDPSSAQVRFQIQNRIQRIFKNRDQVRSGTFRGQGPNGTLGDVLFFVRGQDVVVATPTGEFVTFLPGGISNGFVQAAKLL